MGQTRTDDELVNIGLGFATFELLRELGFAFWHPFEPYKPASLSWPETLALESSPRWPVRSFQIHTMHPIELADFLNGWGPEGLWDSTGFDEGFKEELYLHWLVMNRQTTSCGSCYGPRAGQTLPRAMSASGASPALWTRHTCMACR